MKLSPADMADDEIAFWRGFITWWAQEKADPVPTRAWEALERAQRRAVPRQGHQHERVR